MRWFIFIAGLNGFAAANKVHMSMQKNSHTNLASRGFPPAQLLQIRQSTCDTLQTACDSGCMPTGSECCGVGDGSFCSDDYNCVTGGCCPVGEFCTGDATGCADDQEQCGDKCMPKGSVCCSGSDTYCDAGETCSSTGCVAGGDSGDDSSSDSSSSSDNKCLSSQEDCGSGCMPAGAVCCAGTSIYCNAGDTCNDGICTTGIGNSPSSDSSDSTEDSSTICRRKKGGSSDGSGAGSDADAGGDGCDESPGNSNTPSGLLFGLVAFVPLVI